MSAHKHAHNMKLYAEDAQETETPWERWEVHGYDGWMSLTQHPNWEPYAEYRRKK